MSLVLAQRPNPFSTDGTADFGRSYTQGPSSSHPEVREYRPDERGPSVPLHRTMKAGQSLLRNGGESNVVESKEAKSKTPRRKSPRSQSAGSQSAVSQSARSNSARSNGALSKRAMRRAISRQKKQNATDTTWTMTTDHPVDKQFSELDRLIGYTSMFDKLKSVENKIRDNSDNYGAFVRHMKGFWNHTFDPQSLPEQFKVEPEYDKTKVDPDVKETLTELHETVGKYRNVIRAADTTTNGEVRAAIVDRINEKLGFKPGTADTTVDGESGVLSLEGRKTITNASNQLSLYKPQTGIRPGSVQTLTSKAGSATTNDPKSSALTLWNKTSGTPNTGANSDASKQLVRRPPRHQMNSSRPDTAQTTNPPDTAEANSMALVPRPKNTALMKAGTTSAATTGTVTTVGPWTGKQDPKDPIAFLNRLDRTNQPGTTASAGTSGPLVLRSGSTTQVMPAVSEDQKRAAMVQALRLQRDEGNTNKGRGKKGKGKKGEQGADITRSVTAQDPMGKKMTARTAKTAEGIHVIFQEEVNPEDVPPDVLGLITEIDADVKAAEQSAASYTGLLSKAADTVSNVSSAVSSGLNKLQRSIGSAMPFSIF